MNSSRRQWCAAAAGLAAMPWVTAARAREVVRIGLTAVILDDQVAFLEEWAGYLERKLEAEVRFVQRGNYRGINDLLRARKLDFAWICGAPYVRQRAFLQLLAVPLNAGRPLYRSYLIVARDDARVNSLLDLRGKVFAYSDPDSNSGYLYTQNELIALNERPSAFFGRTFFTWAHRNVVDAVSAGLADGGCVDGHVWDTLAKQHPASTRGTRIVEKSPEFGYPPFVAHASIPSRDFAAMQAVLLGMAADRAGARLLARLNLDGFALPDERLFDSIARMVRTVEGERR